MAQIKVRVYELAKALNVPNKAVMDVLEKQFNVHLKSHSSSIDQDVADRLVAHFGKAPFKPATATASTSGEESLPSIIVIDRVRPTRPTRPSGAPGLAPRPTGMAPTGIGPRPQPPLGATPRPPGAGGNPSRLASPGGAPGGAIGSSIATGANPGRTATLAPQAPPRPPSTVQAPAASQTSAPTTATNGSSPSTANPPVRPTASNTLLVAAAATPQARPERRPPEVRNEPSPSDFMASTTTNHQRNLAPAPVPRKPAPTNQSYGGFGQPRAPGGPGMGSVLSQPQSRPPAGQRRPETAGAPARTPSGGGGQPSRNASSEFAPSRMGASIGQQRPGFGPNRPGQAGRGGGGSARPGGTGRPTSGGGRQTRSAKQERENAQREERRLAAKEAADAIAAVQTGAIILPGQLTLKEFSAMTHLKETDIIRHLFMRGMMVTVNQSLDVDLMVSIGQAMELDIRKPEVRDLSLVEVASVLDHPSEPQDTTDEATLISRPPVISIMGHVDHGKTSLLDAIRQSRHRIVDTEAGGITQRIGAYTVEQDGKTIVFLDTPGHEAFTSMRMRGAQATDIAILVVAADDSVMPQTIEAINHAKAAKLPIIVAINKIDKAGADPFKVKSALMEHGLISEELGGETIMVEVSALQKLGIDDLLEMIVLVSDIQNLRANPNTLAEGVIIEAKLDKRKGPVATALVQKGTLKIGDNLLIGSVGGRVRALINDQGERLKETGPSMPVEILGLDDVPHAGDSFRVITDDREFKSLLSEEKLKRRDERLSQRTRMAGGLTVSMDDENKKELRLILKGDTQGAVEAATQSISRLATDEVAVNILHTGTGDVTEADVMLATASQALIIGFNVKEDGNAARIAEQEGIDIQKFDVIYHMVERVQERMLGELDAVIHITETGEAEVRALFAIGKTTVVAGCMVTTGKIVRNGKAVVKRAGKVIFEGTIDVLKRFKDDAKEVAQGYECGISFSKFNALQEGDLIVCSIEEKRARTSLQALVGNKST